MDCRAGCHKSASLSAFNEELADSATFYIADGLNRMIGKAATIVLSTSKEVEAAREGGQVVF